MCYSIPPSRCRRSTSGMDGRWIMGEVGEGYRGSIFAHELAAVLGRHDCTIESLRRAPFTFDKEKVARLDGSQRGVAQLPALSHGELMSIVLLLKLSEEERLRLYAALIALGAQ